MYPLKALWAASHRLAVAASSFNSVQARNGLRHLDFKDSVRLDDHETTMIILDELHLLKGKGLPIFAADVRESVAQEGERITRELKTIKRNARIVAEAKRLKGYVCEACEFDFGTVYGAVGEGFIEAHHIEPLSARNGVSRPTAVEDFAVLCSNCHSMIHRTEPAMSVSDLKKLIKKARRFPNEKYRPQLRNH
jgi:hypothetical protein